MLLKTTSLTLLAAAWPIAALAADPQTVIIAGKLQRVQHLIDRKVYNVAGDLQAVTGSAADVLNTIPSVNVDADGNITLRGEGKVLILLDGKPSAQFSGASDALLQYGAQDIEKIEVMTTAPAEYRAAGAGGVINIVTRKRRQPGSAGSLQANAGNKRRAVLGASASYNADQWKLAGGFGLRQDDRERTVSSKLDSVAHGEHSEDLRQEHMRRLIPSLKGSADYQMSPQQSLGMDINFRQRGGDRFFDQHSTSPGASIDRHSDGHEWSLSGEQRLRWRNDLGENGGTVEASWRRSTDLERERYAYRSVATLPLPRQSIDHLYLNHDFVSNELALDYRRKLGGHVLKAGASAQRDDNGYGNAGDNVDAGGAAIPNPDLTNRYRFRQTVQAFYASLDWTLGRWDTSTGLRAERTQAHGDQLTTGERNQQQYSGVYPSLHAERALDQGATLSLGYGVRLSRPDPDDLNPYLDHQDIHNLRAGNPNLLPQETATAEAGWRRESDSHNVGVNLYLRRTRNSVTDVTVLLAPDVLLSTKTNLPRSRAGGVEFNVDKALSPSVSARVSSNLFYSQIDATALGAAGLRATRGLNLKGSLDYHPSRTATMQLSVNRTDRRLTPQGSIAPVNIVNVGLKHQVLADLALVATVSDVFNGQRTVRTLSTPDLMQTAIRQQAGRIAYIGLGYQFGSARKANPAKFDYDQGQ